MAVITITATGLGPQLISGIPQLVSLSTNVPSTIFYTLDGSAPTILSMVYVSAILMPTNMSVRLRARAVSGLDYGNLDITFSTNSSDITYARRIDAYGIGIAVDAYGVVPILYDGYTPNDSLVVNVPTRYSDYPLVDLDIQFSKTGPDGIGRGTAIINGPTIGGQPEIDERASSPNNQNVYFNPRSMYVVIDGRDGYEDQSVYIINRAYTSLMDMTKYLQGKSLYEPDTYISGGHVKTFYTVRNGQGIACSYYFDGNTTRWVKSIQSFDPNIIPRGIGDRRQSGGPLVFKWIYNKRSMI